MPREKAILRFDDIASLSFSAVFKRTLLPFL